MKYAVCLVALIVCAAAVQAEDPYWVEPMRAVHSDYAGPGGLISRFGDSITVSMAFFSALRWSHSNTTPEDDAALSWIQSYMSLSCWNWQQDTVAYGHGCWGGTTSNWPMQYEQSPSMPNIEYWLGKDQPEIAVIMWGTNDLSSGPDLAGYTSNMTAVVQACKANGTVPILTTIPPRHGYVTKSGDYAEAVRQIALSEQVPLIDYHDEIVTRRPHNPPTDTWDGADPMWSGYSGYEVPTLISRDGVHPSNWSAGVNNFDVTEGLNKNGFTLRNWLTLHKCYEVFQSVIDVPPFDMTLDFAYLGEGKYGYTLGIDGKDGQQKSYFANMTFEGTGGGQIQQTKAIIVPGVLEYDVDAECDAWTYDGLGEPPYDINKDSWFAAPFACPPANVVALTQGENAFHIEAGTGPGSQYEDAKLAQIVCSGDVSYNGVISRQAKNYDVSGVIAAPLPGDASLDGFVDGADYTLWADHYLMAGQGWGEGNFNGDAAVDGADYTIWADFYTGGSSPNPGTSGFGGLGGSTVPEPAGLALMALGGAALLRRRRPAS
jgi:hypothetical protein